MEANMSENSIVVLAWKRGLRSRGDSIMVAIPHEFMMANNLKVNDPIRLELLSDRTLKIVPELQNE
jgi:antitoxin component of MazEF toxin-antitoxin module